VRTIDRRIRGQWWENGTVREWEVRSYDTASRVLLAEATWSSFLAE